MLILMAVLSWLVLSILIGAMGRHRMMGFWGYFFASIILTPIIGLLLVLVSSKKNDNEL
jgi:uncharacterized membrane protein YhdT